MREVNMKPKKIISLIFLGCSFALSASTITMASVCEDGKSEPPFLSAGVDPNVLLMIDNSASMYDPAYDDVTEPGFCNDDSYASTTSYGGYFDPAIRYYYNLTPVAPDFKKFKSGATTQCNTATGTVYRNADICITINAAVPEVTAFEAKGNFLNWATASKFDIEKNILTGGKYDATYQRLVPESRGCQGKRMIKQVAVSTNAGTPFTLTIGVWPGASASDHLTRLEIFNVSTNGLQFANSACESALAASAFGQVQNLAGSCLMIGQQNESFANSNAAFNHGFQTCWGYPTIGNGDIQRMENACKNVYNAGVNPTTIDTTDSGYVCMGNQATGSGYVGRCVVATGGTPAVALTCTDITCFPNGHPYGADNNQQCNNGLLEECEAGSSWRAAFTTGGTCASGTSYKQAQTIYNCPSSYTLNATNTLCTKSGKPSETPTTTIIAAGCYNNSNNHYAGQPTATVSYPAGCYIGDAQALWIRKQTCVGGTPAVPGTWNWIAGAGAAGGCIEQALRDYCSGLYNPDVIDTSSPVSSVADDHFPNLPSILVTVATNAQLGKPIATLDGYIEQTSTPKGLLQEFSSDLRMGAMRFNGEGTKHECAQANPNRLYNCTADNKDGGKIISYIEADNSTALVNAINGIVADSWTPMAEAMYDAIGYYTQNSTVRLDNYDFFIGGTASFVTGKTYAAGSVVWNSSKWWRTTLGGTTKGTTPITDAAAGGINDWQEMNYPTWNNNTNYSGGAIVSSDGLLYQTVAGGMSNGGSALTDSGVAWTLYYDPVQTHCQSNNILVITDGSPTTDMATVMTNFVTSDPTHNDGDNDPIDPDNDGAPGCGKYTGSTYLDDLAKYAASDNLFFTQNNFIDGLGNPQSKKPISTYVVGAGSLKNEGSGECNPTTLLNNTAINGGTNSYYASENPAQLSSNLRSVFTSIRKGSSAGSAASVISSSRGGEGAIYQAIFWPSLDPFSGIGNPISWTGEVHSLMIDATGYLYEDTDGDRTLSATDDRVIIYFDENSGQTKACYSQLNSDGTCPAATTKNLQSVKYLWSANDWLAKISLSASYPPFDINDIYRNRTPFISEKRQRYIITWEDLNNNGIVDNGEVLPFIDRDAANTPIDWNTAAYTVSGGRGSVIKDFNVNTSPEVNEIISWVRGKDQPGLRSRATNADISKAGSGESITWRLGDVIHSTPTAVTRPSEGYHLLYRDGEYATFAGKYKNRRHMIYFGANDGMLHAVNGGFYDDTTKKFCRTADCDENNLNTVPELGAEMWAYVPYNLLPHLKCLTDPDYTYAEKNHKYFVDQRPRVFDVQIFTEEAACITNGTADANCIHPNGWGTILVGAMRFGGAKEAASALNGVAGDTRLFTSAYFIFDITNPEAPPTLLGEMTMNGAEPDMGYTLAIPTMVLMVDGVDTVRTSKWYLVLGSGPTDLNAVSSQKPRLAILPLDWLIGTNPAIPATKKPFRIPSTEPSVATSQGGSYLLSSSDNGFISDLITVDFDRDSNYMSDVVYFGTVEGAFPPSSMTGKLYRLVTRAENAGKQITTTPSAWKGALSSMFPAKTNPNILINTSRPITASPSVGTDGNNFWIYFGTGRFFDRDDKTDTSYQKYYGIKEPFDCNKKFTWETVEENFTSTDYGNLGLVDTSDILVQLDTSLQAALSCSGGGQACLPSAGTI
ncbi:MAG: hypothetical protein FP815_12665, partial [Desulfobulbaceae bacterium]|nr:hypothetical protein [Desulfobulbaceae bacterium]